MAVVPWHVLRPVTIFAHKGCWDAFVCVWIVLRHMGWRCDTWDGCAARPMGDPQPLVMVHFLAPHEARDRDVPVPLYRGRNVIFLDIMPDEAWLRGALSHWARPNILFIDHHDCSAVVAVARALGHHVVHNTKSAACELTWAHFWGPRGGAMPWFIRYFAAADMFQFEGNEALCPNAREVSLALSETPQRHALRWLDQLWRTPQQHLFPQLVERGAELYLELLRACQAHARHACRAVVPLLPDSAPPLRAWVLAYHGRHLCMGEVARQLSLQHRGEALVLVLYRTEPGRRRTRVWLRMSPNHDDSINLADVAKRLPRYESGGGHRRAAAAWLTGELGWMPTAAAAAAGKE